MNPYSGEIEQFDTMPQGWLTLTPEEAEELAPLSNEDRIRRYMLAHRDDKCGACNGRIKYHSFETFQRCAADQFARLDIKRHEQETQRFFDSLPKRTLNRDSSRKALDEQIEAMRAGK